MVEGFGRKLWTAGALYGALALTGCAPRHQIQYLANGDGKLVAIVDYVRSGFGLTRDAIVSAEEKHGVANSIATFRNIERLDVAWLGPDDLNICEVGAVVGYKTAVTLNTSTGLRTIHVHYGC